MYYLINRNIDHILACITQAYIDDYQTILQIVADPDANIIENAEFRGTYRRYWAMQGRFLTPEFYENYFLILENKRHDQPHLNNTDDVFDLITACAEIYPINGYLSFGRREKSAQDGNGCGFTSAIGSEEPKDLTLMDIQ